MASVDSVRPGWGGRVSERWRDLANALTAVRARLAPAPRAFIWQPQPRVVGSFARARQLAAGTFLFAGRLVQHSGSIWEIDAPSPEFADALQAFDWMDDLAAGDGQAQELLREWTFEWIARNGRTAQGGWQPGLAGRRLIRWISHTPLILKGADPAQSRACFRALGRHAGYLHRAWRRAAPGLERFEALTGLLYAALSLEGQECALPWIRRELGQECARAILADGGIASRNPEALLEILVLLDWGARTLAEAGSEADPRHRAAITRAAAALRTLRMGHGALARFHGSGGGREGRLDQALADTGVRELAPDGTAMGFMRLTSGATVLVIDAAGRPSGPPGRCGHDSSLAIEVSCGTQPLIGAMGPGAHHGEEWRELARSRAAHSTLTLHGAPERKVAERGAYLLRPHRVPALETVVAERVQDARGAWIVTASARYADQGLRHERRIFLAPGGLDLRGEDWLGAEGAEACARLDAWRGGEVPEFSVNFHLDPGVEARLALADTVVSLRLVTGEVWIFRQSGGRLRLEPAVYLDPSHLHARATKRIVVTGQISGYAGRVSWAVRRAEAPQQPGAGISAETADAELEG